MSTRGLIAIMDEDGSCRSIYCHHDMYPSHAGVVLPEHYATREAVEALLALGDLSALGCSLAECEAYCRERGRGTPHADALERPLGSRPRGVRPLLGKLLLSLHGRRMARLRRTGLDARRRLAGIDELYEQFP